MAAKIEISPFAQDTPVPPCGSKIRSKSLYLLPFSRYWHFSIFPKKSKMATENWNFPPLHKRLLYHPVGQKFARNRSISYGFRDIATFSFSAKIKDGRQKWRKLKFHPFAYKTLVPPYGSKIRSKSLYLLQFSRCWHFFIFRKNPRWPPKLKFPPLHRTLLYHPVGQKFARNRSISYRFPDIDTFPFSPKNPRWLPKIEIFPLCTRDSCTTLWVKNSLKIALSLTVFEILTLFYFPLKSKMAAESDENWISPLSPKDYCTTLWVKNSLKIALSLTVFEILTLFHFPRKSKMAAKSGENWNFPNLHRTLLYLLWVKNSLELTLSLTVFEILTLFHFPQKSKMATESGENRNFPPLHSTLLYHPMGQKFARNRSISYGFRDIDTFSFSAKIQDGRQKWRKLKFPQFAQDTPVPPCGSKIRSNSLYLLPFSRYWHFFIFRKSPRWPPKVAKIEIFPLCTAHSCTTLWVKNLLEIAPSLTVFEILTLFHFPQKSKMASKSGGNWNFPPFDRRFL